MNVTIGKEVERAAELLLAGKLVAIPTETVYGLAANALNENAVRDIFIAKGRPSNNPLIIHVSDVSEVQKYAVDVPDAAMKLMERFCPGPLTIVLPKKSFLSDVVTGGRNTVAIRIPAHNMALELLRMTKLPLAAPSANRSGYISPTKAEHVWQSLDREIGYILDGGECITGIESTIVGFEGDVPVIYRKGVITPEDISNTIGNVIEYSGSSIIAPGMLTAHYSPVTPMVLVESIADAAEQYKHKSFGVITYNNYDHQISIDRQMILCSGSDYVAAAKNLYAAMHAMDKKGYDLIIAKKFPDEGIGRALNDRLQRASIAVH